MSTRDPGAANGLSLEAVEEFLRAAWQELLPQAGPGDEGDFFALGGNSIKAALVASRLTRLVGHRVTAADVFFHCTVKDLAAAAWKPRQQR